jgi:uncharacterized protein (DUF952 family)
MNDICHICPREEWEQALRIGSYQPKSLTSEGFIHCSKINQLLRVAEAFFHGQTDLVVLFLDPTKLAAELRWEPGSDMPEELFPHLVGAINLDAIRQVKFLMIDPNGYFCMA